MKDRLLRIPQVAGRLGVSRWTVYKYIKQGDLEAIALPTGLTRIRESDLNNFIKHLSASNLSPYY